MVKWGALGIAVCFVAGSVTPWQRDSATLTGRVSDWQGCRLPGASVTVSERSGTQVAKTETNPDGEFKLTGLAGGEVILRAELRGFIASEFRTALPRSNNLWDTGLELGRIADTPERAVSGTVAGASGDPIEGATVTFFNALDTVVREQVRTDKRGRYSFRTYGFGQYVITVVHRDYSAAAETVDFPTDSSPSRIVNFRLQPRKYCS